MAEYIEREALMKDIEESVVFTVRSGKPSLEIRGANAITDRIKSAPTADVVEVRRGEWVSLDRGVVSCTNCRNYWHIDGVTIIDVKREWKFCPKCGAKMDGKETGK